MERTHRDAAAPFSTVSSRFCFPHILFGVGGKKNRIGPGCEIASLLELRQHQFLATLAILLIADAGVGPAPLAWPLPGNQC